MRLLFIPFLFSLMAMPSCSDQSAPLADLDDYAFEEALVQYAAEAESASYKKDMDIAYDRLFAANESPNDEEISIVGEWLTARRSTEFLRAADVLQGYEISTVQYGQAVAEAVGRGMLDANTANELQPRCLFCNPTACAVNRVLVVFSPLYSIGVAVHC